MGATYRVIIAGVLPGFDPDTALAVVARLLRADPELLREKFAGSFVVRTVADPGSAARLQRVLRMAGCQCEVERVGSGSRSLIARLDTLRIPMLAMAQSALVTLADIERRSVHWLLASASFIRSRVFGRRATNRTAAPIERSLAELRARRTMLHAAAMVALAAAVTLLSDPMPGHTALSPARPPSTAFDPPAGLEPAAPAAPEFFIRTENESVGGAVPPLPGVSGPRTTRTALGVVSVAPDETGITPYWQLRWNSVTLRDLRAETPPALIPQHQHGARQVLATQMGEETIVVVDSGERTAMCPASRVLLVVLAPGQRVRTRELPNQCVELESVVQHGAKLLFRFYDQPRATLAFEQSRFVKLVPERR